MPTCWFTSYIGFPDFYATAGNEKVLAEDFLTLANAAVTNIPYSDAKRRLTRVSQHQAETKKAAFQEFGLLYVIPGSDVLKLTPLGRVIRSIVSDSTTMNQKKWSIHFSLARALARYQFQNPTSVVGSSSRRPATSTDVLPYLSMYYLLLKLDGFITDSELFGGVFGLEAMKGLRPLEEEIRQRRVSGAPFPPITSLPSRSGTAENLRIYLMSHLGLSNAIVQPTRIQAYGRMESGYSIVDPYGYEVIRAVLQDRWPDWEVSGSPVPSAQIYPSLEEYFTLGLGDWNPRLNLEAVQRGAEYSATVLSEEDEENLAALPAKTYEEGRKKLTQHHRLENVRNRQLVNDAKLNFRRLHGNRLFCEVCSLDFSESYGARGRNFIEAHHKVPISTLEGPVTVTVDAFAMLCANCHRMIHRAPWISLDDLKNEVQKRRST